MVTPRYVKICESPFDSLLKPGISNSIQDNIDRILLLHLHNGPFADDSIHYITFEIQRMINHMKADQVGDFWEVHTFEFFIRIIKKGDGLSFMVHGRSQRPEKEFKVYYSNY